MTDPIRTDPIRAALERLVRDIEYLADHSSGVVELHQNGDLAPWAELLEQGAYSCWLGDALAAARAALDLTPAAPLKERPDFIAGYREGLADGRRIVEHEDADRAALTEPELEHDLRQQWNQQADEFNQWDSLDSSEQLAWAQARALQLTRIAELEAEQMRLKPVPVGDPPKPEDCDTEGRCWWFVPASVLRNVVCPYWCLAPAESPRSWFTHWLPAHALLIPQQEVE